MKHQPMRTAPRDGTSILAWEGDRWVAVMWDKYEWCGDHHSATHGHPYIEDDLTAWMPMPPAP
jgi:hypothetical protein